MKNQTKLHYTKKKFKTSYASVGLGHCGNQNRTLLIQTLLSRDESPMVSYCHCLSCHSLKSFHHKMTQQVS